MLKKSESKKSFFRMFLVISLAFCMTVSLASSSYAAGRVSETASQSYLAAPAVGSNVIGYMTVEYLNPETSYISTFVRKCECLKRLSYTDSGVLVTYPLVLSRAEFDAFTPTVLVGMIDTYGQLSAALADGQNLIAVIERVLEFKKVDNRFVARVSLKFVSATP